MVSWIQDSWESTRLATLTPLSLTNATLVGASLPIQWLLSSMPTKLTKIKHNYVIIVHFCHSHFAVNCLPTAKKKTDVLDEKYRVNSRKGRVVHENMVVFDQKGKKVSVLKYLEILNILPCVIWWFECCFQPESQSQDDGHHKTKNKFVNFTLKSGEAVLLKGEIMWPYVCCAEFVQLPNL